MHSERFLISSNEVDPFLRLSIPSLFRLLQAIATSGVAEIGAGKEETTDKGYLWVITRMQVEIERLPSYMEEIALTTYPGERVGFFYFRHFYAKDEKGELLFKASSSWALLKQETHEPVLRPPFPSPLPIESLPDQLGRPEKLQKPTSFTECEKRKITYSMCDLNGHLNNTRYLEMIVDAFPRPFHAENVLSSIVLNFEKEIQEGEEVECFLSPLGDRAFFVQGKANGEERFLAKLVFKARGEE